MEIKRATSVLILVTFLVIADVEAGWKFWKKDKTTTTTEVPSISNPVGSPVVTPSPSGTSSTTRPVATPNNAGSAILNAGDPGLAIGVGSTGGNIRNNARPSRPNPGTEVGLDVPMPKPGRPGTGGNSGQGYRDWAADLTGAGEPGRRPPKLPAQGPALDNEGARPASLPGSTVRPQTAGSRPVSIPGNTPVQPQSPGSRPSSVPESPTGSVSRPGAPTPDSRPNPLVGQGQPNPNLPTTGGNQVSTLHVGTLKPTAVTTPSPFAQRSPAGSSGNPSSPGSLGSPQSPGSPGRTWADVAGGGSRPNSPTPSPREPGHPTGQPIPGKAQPRPQTPTQPGQSRPSAGAIVTGGALAGAAIAGGKVYSSNPTYTKGNAITDEDLEKLSEALFIKDSNNANRHVTLNLQKQTSSSSTLDEAPQPLFSVNAEAFQIPTIQRVLSIFDNYQLETHVNEHISVLQREEESLLVDTFLSTNVMSAAMRFLADKAKIRKDYYEYKDTLRKIWFNLFSRGQGKIGSTGFEHVFMAELKPGTTGKEVIGLHNWIYYSKEEMSGRVDYNGYLKKVDLGNKASIVKIRTKFNGHDKPVTTLFVGTSPELEMSLYTVCFFARPDANCPVSLGGTKFNIITHKFKYRGNDLVGTAYPDI